MSHEKKLYHSNTINPCVIGGMLRHPNLGDQMIDRGKALVKDGNAEWEQGLQMVEQGKAKVERGNRMIEDGKQIEAK